MAGRAHVGCSDVRRHAAAVLQHRILLNYDGQADGQAVPTLIERLLSDIPEQTP
jgi:MoxR-like ATPase